MVESLLFRVIILGLLFDVFDISDIDGRSLAGLGSASL